MASAKRPQAHALGVWIVNQHRTFVRTDKLHTNEAGLLVVVADMLLAVGMEGADGDAVRFDSMVMLDGVSQRIRGSAGEGSSKQQGWQHRLFHHFEHAFHALLAVALEEQQLILAIKMVLADGCGNEANSLGIAGQALIYRDACLGRLDNDGMGNQTPFHTDGQLYRYIHLDDHVVRLEKITPAFNPYALYAIDGDG